jgi:hypothetical protein
VKGKFRLKIKINQSLVRQKEMLRLDAAGLWRAVKLPRSSGARPTVALEVAAGPARFDVAAPYYPALGRVFNRLTRHRRRTGLLMHEIEPHPAGQILVKPRLSKGAGDHEIGVQRVEAGPTATER